MSFLSRLRGTAAAAAPSGPPIPAGSRLAPGRGLPGNVRTITVRDYHGPHPITKEMVTGIDTLYGAGQAGRLGNIRWGEKANDWNGNVYAGDLGPLQRYAGGQLIGTSALMRNSAAMESGLPATSTVPGQPANQMLALLITADALGRGPAISGV